MKPERLMRALLFSTFLRAPATAAAPALAQETEFPQEIDAPEAVIVVYQPQPEKLKGNVLSGRAATSLKAKGKTEPVFGAFWFTSIIDTDAESRLVTLRDIHVTKVRWPDSKPEDEARFTKIVEGSVAEIGFTMTTDRLSASLASAERELKSMAELKHDPPRLLFTTELVVLLLYDGDPRWGDVESSGYERTLNTPYLVVRDKRSGKCYLSSGKLWYASPDPLAGWQPIADPPSDLVAMLPKDDSGEPAPAKPPKIVVATEPTELVATEGEPRWKSVAEGRLLYVENAETPWLREIDSGQMYVLLSGRWFRAGSAAGPWSFVRPDQLPEAFKAIPAGSDIAGVRVSVAGTEEAEDAMLDADIPQTAAIKRSEAKFEVEYDGEPVFETIPGTSVKHAVNTAAQVLLVSGSYYAVDSGVWFVASGPKGPWAVADSAPEDEIQKIPPSSSAYNVTHVHVYQSTPEVVYVGYTPGYRWAFPYYGVPVYGTGWYYPPHPRWYYPRPYTFGLHVGYNPWTGWNFGTSWSVGFLSFGVGWGGGWGWGWDHRHGSCGGWYGGYRPGWGHHHHYRGRTEINISNTINYGNHVRITREVRDSPRHDRSRLTRDNIYTRPENRARVADRATVQKNVKQARSRRGEYNNVLADRDGNLVRKTGANWQTREGGKWQNFDRDAVRDKAQKVDRDAVRPKPPQVDRDAVRPTPTIDRDQARKRAEQVDRSGVQQDWQNRQRARQRETVQRQMPKPKPQPRATQHSSPAPKQMPSRPAGGAKAKH
jgi:hypothetical protein